MNNTVMITCKMAMWCLW